MADAGVPSGAEPRRVHLSGAARYRVVVVRVELPEANGDAWRVELLEVGQRPGGDRLLGRATDAAGACRTLQRWFDEISTDTRPDADPPAG